MEAKIWDKDVNQEEKNQRKQVKKKDGRKLLGCFKIKTHVKIEI